MLEKNWYELLDNKIDNLFKLLTKIEENTKEYKHEIRDAIKELVTRHELDLIQRQNEKDLKAEAIQREKDDNKLTTRLTTTQKYLWWVAITVFGSVFWAIVTIFVTLIKNM